MRLPKSFECMGFTVKVETKVLEDPDVDGHFYGRDSKIVISEMASPQTQAQTFWHEYMHCVLTYLGYKELNENEQFVDQMAQCLYQLEKTRKSK